MGKLSAAVGPGKPNTSNDVKVVQHLLVRNQMNLIPFILPKENGVFDSVTALLIREFQMRWIPKLKPDGVVDPRGQTLTTLLAKAAPEPPEHVRKFIEMALPAAKAVKAKWGVPVSVLIAQGALESGWGQHVKDNAYFGIKGKSDAGNSTNFTTQEVVDGKRITIKATFRAYKDFDEAADDYGQFLKNNPGYAEAFKYTDKPLQFVDAVAKAGYATDPTYAKQLKSIINSFNLTQYD